MLNRQRWAPYAPPATVISVLRYYREREVPETITAPDLGKAGVRKALWPRVFATLKFLKLIEDDGLTTRRFRELRDASLTTYPAVLAEILRVAYQPIFADIDPARATDGEVRGAFHPYNPGGQRSRMIALFRGLCLEAGISFGKATSQPIMRPVRVLASGVPKARANGNQGRTSRPNYVENADPAVAAWIAKLPEPGKPWALSARKRWMQVLEAILEAAYPQLASDADHQA